MIYLFDYYVDNIYLQIEKHVFLFTQGHASVEEKYQRVCVVFHGHLNNDILKMSLKRIQNIKKVL